ncbi:hypothetical protein V5J35_003711 [Endozoicomonas sp. NE40]|uniref:RepB/MobA-like C-terminal domain-containing protein n=2 Tax=Endozoicomonas lisbonensis TaxID=3120522 RepID=A0ABV2SN22_9GAMM
MKSDPSTADTRYVKMALRQHPQFSKKTVALDQEINWEKLDIKIIKKLLGHGFSQKQISNAVRRYSPEAVRSDKGAEEYAKNLVQEVASGMKKGNKGTVYSNNDYSM